VPTATPPDALLLIAPGCTHCPAVLEALCGLVKQGALGRLEIVNIAVHPQRAQALGARSAPWTRIGDFELEGARCAAELALWAERATSPEGYGLYLGSLLEQGELERVTQLIRRAPQRLISLVQLLSTLETPMAVRIGAGAVIEELAGSGLLGPAVAPLRRLLAAEAPQIRADACHYLGLTGDPDIAQAVTPLLQDKDAEVREIARETLDALAETGASER
jgi:hypothetical protein